MNLEVLSQGLRLAVDQAFEIDKSEQAAIEASFQQCNIQQAHSELAAMNGQRSTGLRQQLAEAYTSGDRQAISEAQAQAFHRAVRGIGRTVLRQKVQSTQKNRSRAPKDSTIRQMNRRMGR